MGPDLLTDQPPSVSLSPGWLIGTIVGVFAVGSLMAGATSAIGDGRDASAVASALLSVVLLLAGYGIRRAFDPMLAANRPIREGTALAQGKVTRVSKARGLRFGTATVRFMNADGEETDAEMILTMRGKVAEQLMIRYIPNDTTWVAADPPVVDLRRSMRYLARATDVLGGVLLVCSILLLL